MARVGTLANIAEIVRALVIRSYRDRVGQWTTSHLTGLPLLVAQMLPRLTPSSE
jgi:hypothetical protein